jgi:hypothetical protein
VRVWVFVELCLGLCFLPVALLLGGKNVPSLFGIEIHYRSMD